jgi:hypothetical protein
MLIRLNNSLIYLYLILNNLFSTAVDKTDIKVQLIQKRSINNGTANYFLFFGTKINQNND